MKALEDVAFPIASVAVDAAGKQSDRLLGTGFFVNRNGTIATAAHVVRGIEPPIHVGLRFASARPKETTWVRTDPWEFAPSGIDIAISKVPHELVPFFGAGSTHNGVWQEVMTSGFPESGFRYLDDLFAATQTGFRGYIAATHSKPDLVGIPFKGEIIQLDFPIPKGMSGSPLFAKAGSAVHLVGVCAGNWESEQIDYQVLHIDDAGREYREVKTRAELKGLATSLHCVLNWVPASQGISLRETFDKFVPNLTYVRE